MIFIKNKMTRGTADDMRAAAKRAKKALTEKNLCHVVYATVKKNEPDNVYILDPAVELETDDGFNALLKHLELSNDRVLLAAHKIGEGV